MYHIFSQQKHEVWTYFTFFLCFSLKDQITKDYDAVVFDVLRVNAEEIAVSSFEDFLTIKSKDILLTRQILQIVKVA